jgi:transposase
LWRQSFSYADRPTVFLPVEVTEEVGVSQLRVSEKSGQDFR